MDVTVGYGAPSPREKQKPVFVVKGSETFAAIEDEGWDAVEHAFFVAGAALDKTARPARPPRDWRAIAGWVALGLLVAIAVLVAITG